MQDSLERKRRGGEMRGMIYVEGKFNNRKFVVRRNKHRVDG